MKNFPIIVLYGEYIADDFFQKHFNEFHTINEWVELINDSDEYKNGLFYEVKTFDTLEQSLAYQMAIDDIENYLSSDFYTFRVIKNILTQ